MPPSNIPCSFQTVSGFFSVPRYLISSKGCETGPMVYSPYPYPRRLESLTICRFNLLQRQHLKTLSVGPAGV